MPAIVPYSRKRLVIAAAMPNKRARLAYAIGSHIYQNRGKYSKAARVIGRAWRRRRSRDPRGLGRIGTGGAKVARCKRHTSENSNIGLFNTRTLYQRNLTAILHTTTNSIQDRQRDIVNIRGFKFCFHVRNNGTVPQYHNVAVVFDKRSNDGSATIASNDFFRGLYSERALDFDQNLLTALNFHCLPLNKDRFTILWHKRFVLGPGSTPAAAYTARNRDNYKTFMKYLPLKKQIQFEDDNPQSSIWLIQWADRIDASIASIPQTNDWSLSRTIITYFREPKP